jgi:hypothetical protein
MTRARPIIGQVLAPSTEENCFLTSESSPHIAFLRSCVLEHRLSIISVLHGQERTPRIVFETLKSNTPRASDSCLLTLSPAFVPLLYHCTQSYTARNMFDLDTFDESNPAHSLGRALNAFDNASKYLNEKCTEICKAGSELKSEDREAIKSCLDQILDASENQVFTHNQLLGVMDTELFWVYAPTSQSRAFDKLADRLKSTGLDAIQRYTDRLESLKSGSVDTASLSNNVETYDHLEQLVETLEEAFATIYSSTEYLLSLMDGTASAEDGSDEGQEDDKVTEFSKDKKALAESYEWFASSARRMKRRLAALRELSANMSEEAETVV